MLSSVGAERTDAESIHAGTPAAMKEAHPLVCLCITELSFVGESMCGQRAVWLRGQNTVRKAL